jgi:hypothetical protein
VAKVLRPIVVSVGRDHSRTFGSLRSAYGYALHETLNRPIGTHTVVSHRGVKVAVVLDRLESFRVMVKFQSRE